MRLTFRAVGAAGRYPDWLRALRGKSGAYVIRETAPLGSPEVVYVGESHTGNLYETVTRHFQGWARGKGFWRLRFVQQHDPGTVYSRGDCEVAIRCTPSTKAPDAQDALIARLRPRDNVQAAIPF